MVAGFPRAPAAALVLSVAAGASAPGAAAAGSAVADVGSGVANGTACTGQCTSNGWDCTVIPPFEPCTCEAGYGARTVDLQDYGAYRVVRYACCPGVGSDGCGTSPARLGAVAACGAAAAVLGAAGAAVASCQIRGAWSRQQPGLSAADAAVADRRERPPRARLDGRGLHNEVPRDRWCVTFADLAQFRRLVSREVREGRIAQTDLDRFDPEDTAIGPNVYTVNEQFIKPVTAAAGGASWALMLHPEGLPCQLFVTHAWAEGMYEFIDKVLASWTPGLDNAYCCMLSNPQNLDISRFLQSPETSPFAEALRSASHMLVVPNRSGSIYSRIWCAYEAFLAYSWEKEIVTARSPVPKFWPKVLRVACFGLAGAGIFAIVVVQSMHVIPMLVTLFLALVALLAVLIAQCRIRCLGRRGAGNGSRAMAYLVPCSGSLFAMAAAALFLLFPLYPATWLFLFAACAGAGAAEADRLWDGAAAEQARQLEFSGFLRNAQSSNDEDKVLILKCIQAKPGQEEEADRAVRVLIRMGMCTPRLRRIANRLKTDELCSVTTWSCWRLVCLGGGVGVCLPMLAACFLFDTQDLWLTPHSHWKWSALVVCHCLWSFEGIAWMGMFVRLKQDCKSFAIFMLWFQFVPVVMFVLTVFIFRPSGLIEFVPASIAAVLVVHLITVLSFGGPEHVIEAVPWLGPCLVRMALQRNRCRGCGGRVGTAPSPDLPEGTASEGAGASTVRVGLEARFQQWVDDAAVVDDAVVVDDAASGASGVAAEAEREAATWFCSVCGQGGGNH